MDVDTLNEPDVDAQDAAPDAAAGPEAPGNAAPEQKNGPAEATPSLPSTRLLVGWVPESSRQRLLESHDYEIVEDLTQPESADLIAISTRMPRGHSSAFFGELRRRASGPIVVLAHAGGEALAVEVMRAGGDGVIAEGNEEALLSFLKNEGHDTSLIDTYDQQLGRSHVTDVGLRGRDAVTGLPTLSVFDGRLQELAQAGLPRVGFLEVLRFGEAARKLSAEAINLLRRRLATQYAELARAARVELFVLGPAEFALLGPGLSAEVCQRLGGALVRTTEAFAPTGGQPLGLIVGHAGPEATSEVSTLRELAQRALALARSQGESAVVSADDLSRTLASTTELEAALRVVDAVERHDDAVGSHGQEVAELATRLAHAMGFETHERVAIRLAAHLHDIGKVALPPETMNGDGLEGELRDTYRQHPERGADYLLVSAGPEVAQAVRSHHERWDGNGFPDGLAGESIPVWARLIAVANAVEHWSREEGGRPAALARLREESRSAFDPGIVEIAIEVLGDDAPEADRNENLEDVRLAG